MDVKHKIMSLIYECGTTLTKVCKQISATTNNPKFTQKGISSKFYQKTVRFDEIQLILKELGYRIEFVKDE